jgi:hypothetical protein
VGWYVFVWCWAGFVSASVEDVKRLCSSAAFVVFFIFENMDIMSLVAVVVICKIPNGGSYQMPWTRRDRADFRQPLKD